MKLKLYRMLGMLALGVLACAAVSIPVLAFAGEVIQAPTPAAAPGDFAIPGWLDALIGFGILVGTWALKAVQGYFSKAMDLAAEKTDLAFLARIDDVAMPKVMELWQTEVKAVKAAASDGKLTQAERDGFERDAVDWLKSLLDYNMLAGVFGSDEQIEQGLKNVVAKNVVRAKNAGKAVASVDPSKP